MHIYGSTPLSKASRPKNSRSYCVDSRHRSLKTPVATFGREAIESLSEIISVQVCVSRDIVISYQVMQVGGLLFPESLLIFTTWLNSPRATRKLSSGGGTNTPRVIFNSGYILDHVKSSKPPPLLTTNRGFREILRSGDEIVRCSPFFGFFVLSGHRSQKRPGGKTTDLLSTSRYCRGQGARQIEALTVQLLIVSMWKHMILVSSW